MGIIPFLEDDGVVNYRTTAALGTAIAQGTSTLSQRTYDNRVEYTGEDNVSQTAEYRHLPTSIDQDDIHRR
jgi:hypothetical protein